MKKRTKLFTLLTLLLIGPVMYSQQNVDRLFKDFINEKGVIHVGVGKIVMSFAGLFTDMMGVNGVEVYSFEDCHQSVKDKLNKAIATLKDANYETLVSVNEEKEHTKILVKTDGEVIRELIVMTSGDEPALVRIKGKINPSDIEKVIKDNK